MTVKILYFASLRETLGYSSETLTLSPDIATVGALRAHLARRGGVWDALAEGKSVRAAVNQQMVGADGPISSGDEVAFFPPVTGG